ncbi:PAP7 [Symbiodinium natans]|uniref:PAP7 protein n=1 Tax=Symbiodinium natans TaxID=878477 RepID=A0A812KCF6_9DINO|nr:PAP7 [Symbiodinium natans]
MAEATRKVVVCTPGGRELEVEISKEATVWALKEQLQNQVGGSLAGMTLLGEGELQDDWKLGDDAGTLTLVMSSFPTGTFTYDSGSREFGPAGMNTSATVTAEFHKDGRFCIKMEETEITSDDEDDEYDPYDNSAAWDHEYRGTFACSGPSRHELRLSVSDWTRKGNFEKPSPDTELHGVFETFEELKLQLPFAAGGCNEGTAGLRWLSLQATSSHKISI